MSNAKTFGHAHIIAANKIESQRSQWNMTFQPTNLDFVKSDHGFLVLGRDPMLVAQPNWYLYMYVILAEEGGARAPKVPPLYPPLACAYTVEPLYYEHPLDHMKCPN